MTMLTDEGSYWSAWWPSWIMDWDVSHIVYRSV